MTKPCILGVSTTLTLSWLLGIFMFLAHGQVDAQSLRDPTVPPAESGLAGSAAGGKSSGAESGAMTVIVRNGHPYLAVGTRLYAQGQKLGQARIERITETEIWLREGGVLRKVPQFPGIQRRKATSAAPTPACAFRFSQSSSSGAPCAKAQP